MGAPNTPISGNIPYEGVRPTNPPNIFVETRAPTANDTGATYNLGDVWIDRVGMDGYVLVSKAGGPAVWAPIGGVAGSVNFLTGDVGAAIPPAAGNINIQGGAAGAISFSNGGAGQMDAQVLVDGTSIVITGNTLSTAGAVATQYDGDVGSAVPALGILNIVGTAGEVSTTAAGNTVTIDLDGSVTNSYPVDNGGPGVPALNAMSFLGSTSTDFTNASGIETHVGATTNEVYLENRRFVSAFVVDPSATVGLRGEYQTISAAIVAANAAGGGTVYVRPGTYAESLTMQASVNIVGLTTHGSTRAVVLDGTVNADYNGIAEIRNFYFSSAASVTVGSAAGTPILNIYDSEVNNTSTICSSVNANLTLSFYRSILQTGAGANLFGMNGPDLVLNNCRTIRNGTTDILSNGTSQYTIQYCSLEHPIQAVGTSSINVEHSSIRTGASSPVNINAAGATVRLYHVTTSSSAASTNWVIGTGTLNYANVIHEGTAENIAGTLAAINVFDWQPYATAAASEALVDKGVCGFDSNDFTVTDGFVQTTIPSLEGSGQTVGAVTADIITFALGATPGCYTFEVDVAGFNAGTPIGAGYNMSGAVRTTGAAATLLGTPDKNVFEEGALVAANADIVASGNNMIVRVTGVAGLTIDWRAVAVRVFAP